LLLLEQLHLVLPPEEQLHPLLLPLGPHRHGLLLLEQLHLSLLPLEQLRHGLLPLEQLLLALLPLCMKILLITIFEISIYMYEVLHTDISLHVGAPHYNIPYVF
jgi:hypothetical protein